MFAHSIWHHEIVEKLSVRLSAQAHRATHCGQAISAYIYGYWERSRSILGILVHRDRSFWYRDRPFRLNVTGHSGLS